MQIRANDIDLIDAKFSTAFLALFSTAKLNIAASKQHLLDQYRWL